MSEITTEQRANALSAMDSAIWGSHPDAGECRASKRALDAVIAEGWRPAPKISDQPVTLTYTNWRGETAERTIIPLLPWFGATDWHPEPQWLLKAIDVEKGAERDFALKDFGQPTTTAAEVQALRDALIRARKYIVVGRDREGPVLRQIDDALAPKKSR